MAAAVCALLLAAGCSAPADQARQAACDKVGDLAARLIEQRAGGVTEREALADLSARGEYQAGYVVDGVYAAEPVASPATTRAEIVRACWKRGQR